MSVRLDWEIESEQQRIRQQSGEDPESRRRRRRRRFILLMIPLVVMGLLALAAGFVVFRLREVDAEIEQVLRDTIDAEVTALRVGDEIAFMNFQRSATSAWPDAQEASFGAYQTLKQSGTIQLTGQVVDVAVDGNRARAQVQEIRDGAPYLNTWFYWNYEDGWRHVPPDYTFWGDAATLDTDSLSIRYQAVDAAFASSLRDALTGWLQVACGSVGCDTLPKIQIDIRPDPGLANGWSEDDEWLLKVRSPYTGLARQDAPFDFATQFDLANLLSERLVSIASGGVQPVYPADAFYLRSSIASWLVGRFVSINTNAFLMTSLAQAQGDAAVGMLLKAMQPDSNIDLLNMVLGTTSLAQTTLDWRDYLTWRLALEDVLIQRGDEGHYLALYDTRDDAVRTAAYQRYNAGPTGETRVVVAVTLETAPAGTTQLRAQVEVGNPVTRRDEILFRLVNEHWQRAN